MCHYASDQLPSSIRSFYLGIVFGNSKKMWEPFLDHLASDKDVLCNAADPIHDYVKQSIEAVLDQLPGSLVIIFSVL